MFGHRLFSLIVVLVVVLAACLACGGDQLPAGQTEKETAPPPTAKPAPTAQPTVAPEQSPAPAGAATLALDKTTFAPNEEFQVRFTAPASPSGDAWVGVIPSRVPHGDEAVNDDNDVDYLYLDGQTSGTLTFTAPQAPGSYDLRLNENDSGGAELAFVAFRVVIPTGELEPGLRLDKTTFAPNEQLQVHVTAPSWYPSDAWVGVIPSDVPHGDEAVNDDNDVDYLYLEGLASGTMTFTVPLSSGSYDLRLNDGAGKETASVTFSVVIPTGGVEPTLRLDKTAFAPGEEILVYFTAPSWYPADAWVGLIPSDAPHGDEALNDENQIDYRYVEGQTSGVLTFTAPDEPGSYDLRMNDTDQDGKEVASVTFTVE